MLPSEQANARRLQGYLAQKVAAAADDIAPELLDYVGGDSEEAIDRSIEMVKRKSAEIVTRAMQQQVRPDDVDPVWAAGNREAFGDHDRQLAARVSGMSLDEYSRHREELGTYKSTMSFLGGS